MKMFNFYLKIKIKVTVKNGNLIKCSFINFAS